MEKELKIRLRLICIQDEKILLMYDSEKDFYFYIGGKLEFGETVLEGAAREILEECGNDASFVFNKILYIRDFIYPEDNEHSVELFILGDVQTTSNLEGLKDPEFDGKKWLTWKNIYDLPENLLPQKLTSKLVADYKSNFPNQGEYIGKI